MPTNSTNLFKSIKIFSVIDISIQTIVLIFALNLLFGEKLGWNGIGTFVYTIILFAFFSTWQIISTFLLVYWKIGDFLLAKIKFILTAINILFSGLTILYISTGLNESLVGIAFIVLPICSLIFYVISIYTFIKLAQSNIFQN